MALLDEIVSKLREVVTTDLKKGDPLTEGVKPKGPESSRETVVSQAAKVPSITGLAAPGNTAGPGRPKGSVSETAPTIPKTPGGSSGQEIVYISKKDYPEAPRGTIGSTPNSWKVPAGIGRLLQAKQDGTAEAPTSKEEASAYNKKSKPREVIIAHLSEGKIAKIEATNADGNATDTYKVTIQGNGSGIMKPPTTHFNISEEEVSSLPEDNDTEGWQWNEELGKFSRSKQTKIYTSSLRLFGAGAGTIQHMKSPEREVAGHLVSQLHGLNNVPVTVLRNEGNKLHSVQEWKEGVLSFPKLRRKVKEFGAHDIDVFEKAVPKSQVAELRQSLMDNAVHDIITNANDRHGLNFMIEESTGKVVLIDHGLSFGLSMHGHRNYFLHNCFSPKTKIKMSEALKTRLNNLTFADYKRAMPGLADWEAGQTFLRARYVTWLQDNHGDIDPQKFAHTVSRIDGSDATVGDYDSWKAKEGPIDVEYRKRQELNMLPHQMFESWAKAFLNEASSNSEHPDHNDAKALSELGVFMELGYMGKHKDDTTYRQKGLHKEYEKTIVPSYNIPGSITYVTENHKPMSDSASSVVPTGD